MNCFADLPTSWHPADRGTAFTAGCGGLQQDVAFRFHAGDGVCPVPDAPLTIETVEPTAHGAGLGCNNRNTALRPEPLTAGGHGIARSHLPLP